MAPVQGFHSDIICHHTPRILCTLFKILPCNSPLHSNYKYQSEASLLSPSNKCQGHKKVCVCGGGYNWKGVMDYMLSHSLALNFSVACDWQAACSVYEQSPLRYTKGYTGCLAYLPECSPLRAGCNGDTEVLGQHSSAGSQLLSSLSAPFLDFFQCSR